MNRKLLLLPAILAGTLFATACTDGTTVNTAPADVSGITVTGRGEVEAPSDTGFFDVGVQVTAATVEDARNRAAASADAVIKSLKSNGIDQKDIKTTNLSIQPQYDYKNGSEPKITGYIVTNTVEAKVRKLENFSKIIDDAVKAGGNDARLQGIRFGIEDNEKLIEQAREAAMKDAKKKADQLAKLGGVSLGDPAAINETQTTEPPPKFARAVPATGLADAATPIEPGTGAVIVQISVRWALK
ncbi:MAG: hypothetical protein C0506_13260 [Anaerolinea sp.]|nr:hypothetical protein [Anaerolinea sp.]